ncbi:unnamed protein product, partial [Rotaria magnacalcarata]
YLTPKNVDSRRRFADGSSERPDLVEITRTPDVLLQAHLMIAIDHKDTMKSFSNDFLLVHKVPRPIVDLSDYKK